MQADGELSELESALFAGHLDSCPRCREVASDFLAVSEILRATPLERPRLTDVPVSSARRLPRIPHAALAAVLVIAAALVSALQIPRHAQTPVRHVAMVAAVDPAQELRQLRRPILIAEGRAAIPRNRQVPGETV